MSQPESFPPARALLRIFAATLGPGERRRMGLYVLLSLLGALVGSVAAIAVVPLVQPGHALRVGGWTLSLGGDGIVARASLFAATSGGFALLRWWSARLCAGLVGDYAMSLRRRAHAGLLAAPLPSLPESRSAEIANVLTYNVEIATQGFSALLQLLVAGITAAVSVALAFLALPGLALAAPFVLVLVLLVSRLSSREQAQVNRDYVADMTRLFWLSEDFPRRLRHIRSFGRQDGERHVYEAISARLARGYRRQQELVASGRLLLEVGAVAGIATVLALASVWQGAERAALIAASVLLGRLLPYLVSTRQGFQQLRSALPALALWQQSAAPATAPPPVPSPPAAEWPGPLRIERVDLAASLPRLEVAGLVLAPGRLSLVHGPSGCGKSTLMDVLAGLAEPRAFEARHAGRALDFAAYRTCIARCAYVAQGVRPWQRTVRDCLAWAAPGCSEDAMWEALDDVGLRMRIAAGTEGLDCAVGGASGRLSGGELQRLLLAQVLLYRPLLAVLDEATSALDAESERAALTMLRRRLPHTALLVVSHRPELAALADHCLRLGHAPS